MHLHHSHRRLQTLCAQIVRHFELLVQVDSFGVESTTGLLASDAGKSQCVRVVWRGTCQVRNAEESRVRAERDSEGQ